MNSYHRGPRLPYADLMERVKVAALALLAEGRKSDLGTLKSKGIRASTAAVYQALSDLVAEGSIPPECRHGKRPRCEATTLQAPAPTLDQIAAARAEMTGHSPEVRPAKAEPSVWEWLRKAYWNEQRRAWYRGVMT